jgi:hypothetical protein
VPLGRALLIAFSVACCLVLSFFLARWLTAENRERSAVTDLVRLQAQGDAASMAAVLDGCEQDAACLARVRRNARALARPGDVNIVRYDSGTSYALTAASGPTRVVWEAGDGTPIVQCVGVERRGVPLFGGSIALTSISPRIAGTASCPG